MNTSRIFAPASLAAALLLMSACAQLPARGGAAPLAIGTTVRGELTSSSPVNLKDGSRYQAFSMALAADDVVRLTLAGAVPGVLSLHGPEGEFIGTSDGRPGYGYRNDDVILTQRVNEAGTYVLAVSGNDSRDFGPFRVLAESVETRQGGSIAAGEEVIGWLNGATNRYTLAVEEAGLFHITQRSDELDAYLKLAGNGIATEDDDNGGGLDARISMVLSPGEYSIETGWIQERDSGSYTLSVQRLALPTDTEMQLGGELVSGETITGWVAGTPVDYQLTVPQLSSVSVTMNSAEIDSYLELVGESTFFMDDDSGGGLDAQLQALLAPGVYRLHAADIGRSGGVFTLQAQVAPVDLAPRLRGLPALRDGSRHEANLVEGKRDEYRLLIARAGRYQLDMRSNEFDASLTLYSTQLGASDDDSGGALDARLELALEAGEYLLVAHSYGDTGAGSYSLNIERR